MAEVSKKDVVRASEYLWEIPQTYRKRMRVPARFYSSEKMLNDLFQDRSLDQLVNTTALPGVTRAVFGMPDMHQGYGICVGGVAATDVQEGVISPGAIGFDQGCGVRLLASNLSLEEADDYLDRLAVEMYRRVPSGLGRGHDTSVSRAGLNSILEQGVPYLVREGYGVNDDIANCESGGVMAGADASLVSDKAKKRGADQVGTLGSGNHFVEVQSVETVFDKETAERFGLKADQVVVMIHTGSRGLGHQNCTEYLEEARRAMRKYEIRLPDSNLASMPLRSPAGERFLGAMRAGVNYAFCNRQAVTHYVREAWRSVLGKEASELRLVYDVNHNTAKVEEYEVDGVRKELCVHRKGATRSFPDQPVLVPGSMGTGSYVMVGRAESEHSFHSVCHGAGRRMSRTAARKKITGQKLVKDLKHKGIIVKSPSVRGVAEEAPLAYKDVDEVVRIVHEAGLSHKVARLRPLAVIKGE